MKKLLKDALLDDFTNKTFILTKYQMEKWFKEELFIKF